MRRGKPTRPRHPPMFQQSGSPNCHRTGCVCRTRPDRVQFHQSWPLNVEEKPVRFPPRLDDGFLKLGAVRIDLPVAAEHLQDVTTYLRECREGGDLDLHGRFMLLRGTGRAHRLYPEAIVAATPNRSAPAASTSRGQGLPPVVELKTGDAGWPVLDSDRTVRRARPARRRTASICLATSGRPGTAWASSQRRGIPRRRAAT